MWRARASGGRCASKSWLLAQRLVEESLKLLDMLRHLAGRRCRRGGAAGIYRLFVGGADLLEHPFQIRSHERVCAHIARLLLAPHELRSPEAAELLHQRFQRNRIELLDAQQINVVDA